MTPYELRFQIYQEASRILEQEYQYKFDIITNKSILDKKPFPSDHLQFPTQEQIEERAKIIYNFVEQKRA